MGNARAQKVHQGSCMPTDSSRYSEHVQLTGKAANGDDNADADLRLIKGDVVLKLSDGWYSRSLRHSRTVAQCYVSAELRC